LICIFICTPICTKILILAKSGCYRIPRRRSDHIVFFSLTDASFHPNFTACVEGTAGRRLCVCLSLRPQSALASPIKGARRLISHSTPPPFHHGKPCSLANLSFPHLLPLHATPLLPPCCSPAASCRRPEERKRCSPVLCFVQFRLTEWPTS
jgi:hypothetical protein